MWALRRASIHLRNRCLSSCTTRISSVKSDVASCYLENYNDGSSQSRAETRFHNTHSSTKSLSIVKSFSSLAGSKSSVDHNDVLVDAPTRLETQPESIFESDLSVGGDMQNELNMLDNVRDVGEEKSSETEAASGLITAILSASSEMVRRVLDGWVEEGNEITQNEVSCIMLLLYRRRMFEKALQFSEWLECRKHLEFTENDYARRVDLVAKARGIFEAEKYVQQVPESYRREAVYTSLLKNHVAISNVPKSEKLFNTMKNSFPLTCISCNTMLFLYKRTNRKKIADVVSLMKNENIKPSNVTYQILIDVKGLRKDVIGMEQLFESMKSDGLEPSLRNLASLAHYYAACGLKGKAEAVLKDIDGGNLVKNRYACRFLLPVYAKLRRDDEVGRIWKECESDPHVAECMAAINAWGALGRIEEAEAAFDKILKTLKSPISRHYVVLLDVYADHGMLTKAEELLRRMREGGVIVGGPAWNAIVKLYTRVGEVEKADAILEKVVRSTRGRPSASAFFNVLDQYARRGDVRNAEKIFRMMRNAGYGVEPRSYHSLLYAYINAKAPADAFEERLRRDNIVPDEKLTRLLAKAAAFSTPKVT